VVLGIYFSNSEAGAQAYVWVLPTAGFFLPAPSGRRSVFLKWDSYGANLAELQQSAATAAISIR